MERRVRKKSRFRELAKFSAQLAESKKADEILILDVRTFHLFTDYLLLCSGHSEIHVETIAEEIRCKLKERGMVPGNIEGLKTKRWILMDYGALVVHVFYPETRRFYNLEGLWDGARKVNWQKRKRRQKK